MPQSGSSSSVGHPARRPRLPAPIPIEGGNALIERTPFAPQVFDQEADARAQRRDPIFVGKDQELFLLFASTLRCDDPELSSSSARR
jgi:hypothetical protein